MNKGSPEITMDQHLLDAAKEHTNCTPCLGKPYLNNLEEKYKIKICKTRQKRKLTQTWSGNFKYQEIALFSSANKTFSSWKNSYILRKNNFK